MYVDEGFLSLKSGGKDAKGGHVKVTPVAAVDEVDVDVDDVDVDESEVGGGAGTATPVMVTPKGSAADSADAEGAEGADGSVTPTPSGSTESN